MVQGDLEKRERMVIEWNGPPMPWAPKHMHDTTRPNTARYLRQAAPPRP